MRLAFIRAIKAGGVKNLSEEDKKYLARVYMLIKIIEDDDKKRKDD